MNRSLPVLACWALLACTSTLAQSPVQTKVANPTRLDWEFAVRGFGKGAAKLPADYDSAAQKYQLYVPASFKKDEAASLVLFISPGDGPMGLKTWQKFCDAKGALFASPFGAGNGTPAGQRTRIILDVFDDIRRHYPIDPDRTYLTGFSGGGRMACAIGFALPEYFGGIIPICGTNPLSGPTYLRQRIEERLSVAFVTGAKDMNRKENEEFMQPWFTEIGIRARLWVVPKMGHAIPSPPVIDEVQAWLTADLPRRRDDRKARPGLAVAANDTPSGPQQAERFVETAVADLKTPEHTWKGVVLLQGVRERWGATAAGQRAQKLLKEVLGDEKLLQRIDEQGRADEIKSLSAQAKALERFGDTARAIAAWEALAKNYQGEPIAAEAAGNIKRLRDKKTGS